MTEHVLERGLLDAVCDAQGSALLVIDRDDLVVYGSPQVLGFFPIPEFHLQPGTRLRDLLGSIYDHCIRRLSNPPSREDWIAERVAGQWRERWEGVDRTEKGRQVRMSKRRLPSGFGLCLMTDVTEQKKREEQWRLDQERVEVTEEILDRLPQPLFVLDDAAVIVAINRAMVSLTGLSAAALQGQSAGVIFAAEFLEEIHRRRDNAGHLGEAVALGDYRAWLYRVEKAGRIFTIVSFAAEAGDSRRILSAAPSLTLTKPTAVTRLEGPAMTRADLAGLKILVVSSDDILSRSLTAWLQAAGVDCCAVASGSEQRAFLGVARSADIRIDRVLVDRRMPPLCRALAEEQALAAVMVDADWTPETLGTALAQSREKPFALTPPTEAVQTPQPAAAPSPSAGILVVEDNAVNQIVFSQILEGLGCRYTLAANGTDALRIWQELRPEVVLMDISLPDIHGLDLARVMREQEKAGGPRSLIVGVLVPAFDQDRPKCLEAGMDDAIVKPLSPDMIEHLLQRHGHVARSVLQA
ncbi:response regulator [Rhizobium paknamense]|uniref:PAS domain S-box-containing protein n=1 Tax=Rhizobium paknamense TaxID=1206817 RepID=A0ABU0ICM5_9HYPH|nr:response regulator [Rhizobium paknamense]MDQ0454989.1 PAS domain S-box-containing protein [Rhizobium paknamense]